ncbi:MAG TPA: AMP-binding protein [Anaeromyxobacteraceae bacterium]|nr:AMP-binding protein [Anaeromyxobacteraceae bacterium]
MRGKMGLGDEALTLEHVERYQLARLRELLDHARHRSPHYRRAFQSLAQVASLADLERLPFTTDRDLRGNAQDFLCVSQGEVSRVVTLASSGTTGQPKRLCFTAEEQDSTVDFFHQCLATLIDKGDRAFILLPGGVPGSAGDLIATALRRLGGEPIPHGFVRDLPQAVGVMRHEGATSVVGSPVHALALARYAERVGGEPLRFKAAFLIADHVPGCIVRELENSWRCEVCEHYGMTEMGLGGGIDCQAHEGYHLREADLYFEIVDPLTGHCLPPGERGEVVFTTLTRRGMPLIRYRTGDLSRLLVERCRCGSALRRLERIRGRTTDTSVTGAPGGTGVTMPALDEALFAIPGLVDFAAEARSRSTPAVLAITAWSFVPDCPAVVRSVFEALERVPAVSSARASGALELTVTAAVVGEHLPRGPEKRVISEVK